MLKFIPPVLLVCSLSAKSCAVGEPMASTLFAMLLRVRSALGVLREGKISVGGRYKWE